MHLTAFLDSRLLTPHALGTCTAQTVSSVHMQTYFSHVINLRGQ